MGITALAFDFGTKSIGCAVGQSITGTAQALPAFKAQDGIPNWDAIEKCLKEWKPDIVVVGLPLNMDGTEGYRAQSAREIGKLIQEKLPNIKIIFQDERLSTVEAEDFLIQSNMRRQDRKKVIDQIAACIILQTYLDMKK